MVGGAYAPQHRWRRSIQDAFPGPGGVLLGTSTGPDKVNTLNRVAGWFFSGYPAGVWGVQGRTLPGTCAGAFQAPSRGLPGILQGPPVEASGGSGLCRKVCKGHLPGGLALLDLLQTYTPAYKNEEVLLTKMDLIEFRS